jgi:hypothetical protein
MPEKLQHKKTSNLWGNGLRNLGREEKEHSEISTTSNRYPNLPNSGDPGGTRKKINRKPKREIEGIRKSREFERNRYMAYGWTKRIRRQPDRSIAPRGSMERLQFPGQYMMWLRYVGGIFRKKDLDRPERKDLTTRKVRQKSNKRSTGLYGNSFRRMAIAKRMENPRGRRYRN